MDNATDVSGADRVVVKQWDDGDQDTATERNATVDQIASAVLQHIEFNSTILAAAVNDATEAETLEETTEVIVKNGTDAQRVSVPNFTAALYGFPSPVLSGTTYARNLGDELLDGVNIWRFADGADNGDGTTNDSAMFARALAWSKEHNGRPVYVPPATDEWRLGTALTGIEGATLIGLGQAVVRFVATSTVMTIAGPRLVMKNLRFASSMESTNFAIAISEGADDCIFEDLFLDTGNSFIRTFGDRCRFSNIKAQELYGSLIRLDGTASDNNIYDFGGRNVQTGLNMDAASNLGAGSGPHNNKITRGKKWVEADYLTAEQQLRTGNYLFPTKHVYDEDGNEVATYGGDIFSCTAEGHSNTFEDNETIGSRDGSGTINGDYNVVRGHRASYGLGGGIGMFGSFNEIYGLETKYVRRGLVMMSAFGGYGSYNKVHGGVIRNSRYWGVVTSQVGLRLWVSGASYSSRARYCAVYDPTDLVYRTYVSSTGTTQFGTDLMRHETGSASDGSIAYGPTDTPCMWTFVSKAASLKPVGNVLFGTRFENNGIEAEVGAALVGKAHMRNQNQAENYRYGIRGFSDGLIPDYNAQQQRVIGGQMPVYRRIAGGAETSTTAVLTTDGRAPTEENQMVVSNVQSGRMEVMLSIRDNNSQGFRDWTSTVSFRRSASGELPEFRIGSSVATPTFTQGNGTGLSWLDGITPTWTIDGTNFAIQISVTCPATRSISCRATIRSLTALQLPDDDTANGEEQPDPEPT